MGCPPVGMLYPWRICKLDLKKLSLTTHLQWVQCAHMVETASKQRHAGIDALRLLSMLMVCVLHASFFTGVTPLLNALSCIAVNLFALITGYVCVQSGWKIKRYISLWVQVAFYSVLLFAAGRVLWHCGIGDEYQPSVGACFLPVPLAGGYWYFTAYTGLFMVMPFINRLVLSLEKRQYQALMLLAVGAISLLTVLRRTPELYERGYNMAWLMALYLMGAYFKLHPARCSAKLCLAVYLLCSMVIWGLYHVNTIGFSIFDYATPTSLVSSCALFILFAQWQTAPPRLAGSLCRWAPFAFGVYLLQNHPFVWHWLMKGGKTFNETECYGWWMIVIGALVMFAVFLVLDRFRGCLFGWLKVNQWAERLAAKCPAWLRDLEKL